MTYIWYSIRGPNENIEHLICVKYMKAHVFMVLLHNKYSPFIPVSVIVILSIIVEPYTLHVYYMQHVYFWTYVF